MINRLLFIFLFAFVSLSFKFPENHSFHKNFGLEWVYFVGHLNSDIGETYGYELSFFRFATADVSNDTRIEIFPVHFAISSPKDKRHFAYETLQRDLGSLAGYNSEKIYSGEYEFSILSKNKFRITAKPRFKDTFLELVLDATGEPLVHGDAGISIKSRKNPGWVSHYYSYPRLNSVGLLRIEGKSINIVSGDSWMDHEWSEENKANFSLASQKTSWDWLCLSTDDGSDFVSFNFRDRKDAPPETTGIFRVKNGKIHRYENEEKIQMLSIPTGNWKSPESEITYPLVWKIKFTNGYWIVRPIFNEQEFNGLKSTGIVYWEGMVKAEGEIDGKKRTAKGYLELKGYEALSKWWKL
jgi:predicted secreted hydrolase